MKRQGIEPLPHSEHEIIHSGREFSFETLLLFVLSTLPLCLFDYDMQNLQFTNLSNVAFTAEETFVLGLGLNFVPSAPPPTKKQVTADWKPFDRRLKLHDMFHDEDSRDDVPTGFYIPKPEFHPDTTDSYTPAEGVSTRMQS
eukprot:SAG11_NODE_2435_length_3365_cov_3.390386_2_plen_142_part_00